MTEYELTKTAREELDFECSECGETVVPDVVEVEESPEHLDDWRITVSCVNCGKEFKYDVWDRDIKEVTEP